MQPSKQDGADQMLVINVIDLLSVCAEGEGRSARKYAHKLFSMKDLLKFVNMTSLKIVQR